LKEYWKSGDNIEIPKGIDAAKLNVDILESMLCDRFPEANRSDGEENYSELLENLTALSVQTVADFDTILKGKYAATMEEERTQFSVADPENGYIGSSEELHRAGVYFTHVGLARVALAHHFGDEATLDVINKY
jgi:hypothetical protein